jgi:glycosyltransferase involved in cell wall biosynthesis
VRILWAGVGPWHKTGYGLGAALFPARFRDLGHQVVLSVFGEKTGPKHPMNHPDAAETKRTGLWDGMRVTGPGPVEFALPRREQVQAAFGGHDPDLVIVLKDAWILRAADYAPYRAAVWLAADTHPLGVPDRDFFTAAPGVRAVCVARQGVALARAAGLQGPLYVPFGIDTGRWTPGPREAARDLLGLPHDVFTAGINAQNIGPRKGWGEQLAAFAAFHAKHPKSLLLIHAAPEHPDGMNLRQLAAHLDIPVRFGSHGNMSQAQMLSWYRSLDVLMQGTYGEGFGIPVIEAQACGVPVIGTDCSAITEKIPPGTGWLVRGQRWWNPHHQAWWTIPDIRGLAAALGKAYRGQHAGAAVIREHALAYDADRVTKTRWVPALEELTS